MLRPPTPSCCLLLFFFNDTATTEIYTLSLHDALPISLSRGSPSSSNISSCPTNPILSSCRATRKPRSEEHTSELQSLTNLVCRLLLEKKKTKKKECNKTRKDVAIDASHDDLLTAV